MGPCKIRGPPLTSFLTSSPSNPVLRHTKTDLASSLYTGSSHSGSWVLSIMRSAERPSWPHYLQQHPLLPCPPSRSPFLHSTYHRLKLFISVCPWLFSASSHYNVTPWGQRPGQTRLVLSSYTKWFIRVKNWKYPAKGKPLKQDGICLSSAPPHPPRSIIGTYS